MIQIKIVLKSELCSASGEGFGSAIDTDIVYDAYGFPYIPAKRFKGLLRESAETLLEYGYGSQNTINTLFGIEGETTASHLVMSDAKVINHSEIVDEIDRLDHQYKSVVNAQRILNQYTSIRYATAMNDYTEIEKGNVTTVVKENSLRSIRVINRGVIFYAFVNDLLDDERALLEKSLKLVKHMGLNRSRGYGEVDCSMSIIDSSKQQVLEQKMDTFDDNQNYEVKILYKAITPLMMAKEKSMNSELFIPGISILSAYAQNYLKDYQDDASFYDLFINGKVKYSNAYISNNKGEEFIPVPASYVKIKDAVLENEEVEYLDKIYSVNSTSQVSFIKNKFIHYGHEIKMKEPILSMNYHSRYAKDHTIGHVTEGQDGGVFYQMMAMNDNQYFLGKILGKAKYLKKIQPYLTQDIFVGKSRSVQYGHLEVVSTDYLPIENATCKNYKSFAIILTSPLYLLDNNGLASVDRKLIEQRIQTLISPDLVLDESFISYSILSGYNNKWNLPKPQVNVFNSGSVFVFTSQKVHKVKQIIKQIKSQISEDQKILDIDSFGESILLLKEYVGDECEAQIEEMKRFIPINHLKAKDAIDQVIQFVENQESGFEVFDSYILGENQNEGLGQIIVRDASFKSPVLKVISTDDEQKTIALSELSASTKEIMKKSLEIILEESLLVLAVEKAHKKNNINNTTVGKILMWLRIAELKNTQKVNAFMSNIQSIKDKKKKDEIVSLVSLPNTQETIKKTEQYQLLETIGMDTELLDIFTIKFLKLYFTQLKLLGRKGEE